MRAWGGEVGLLFPRMTTGRVVCLQGELLKRPQESVKGKGGVRRPETLRAMLLKDGRKAFFSVSPFLCLARQ